MRKIGLSGFVLAVGLAYAGAAYADITIGVAGPLTGPNAAFGAQLQKGAEQAAADINAAGGINGENVVIVTGDDVSDPKQGVSVANKFVGEGVQYVVGHFNSGVTIPASEVYNENGILVITPAATNPVVTERGLPMVFRTCGRDDQQGAVAGAYIAENLKDQKVAVVHDKTPYGQGLADETKKAMNAAGVTEVMYEGVNTGDKDFSALISRMKQEGVQIIYFGGLHTEAGNIIRQASDAGLDATLMSGDGIVSNELAQIAGPALEGTLMTFAPDPRLNEGAKEVVEKFRTAGFEPEAYTLFSYAAVEVIKQGIEAAGGHDDTQKVADTLKSGGPWTTVIGEIDYDDKGDVNGRNYVIYEWKPGADGNITYTQMSDASGAMDSGAAASDAAAATDAATTEGVPEETETQKVEGQPDSEAAPAQ